MTDEAQVENQQVKKSGKDSKDDLELPKGTIQKIIKAKLADIKQQDEDGSKSYSISKDALLALTESAKVFISYLTATAYEICKENKKMTLGPEEILSALSDIDLPEHVQPLRQALEQYRQEESDKKKRKQEENNQNDGEKKQKQSNEQQQQT